MSRRGAVTLDTTLVEVQIDEFVPDFLYVRAKNVDQQVKISARLVLIYELL